MDAPRIRMVGELPAWVTVQGKRFEVRLNFETQSHPSFLGAHEGGFAGHWLLCHSLRHDPAEALAQLRSGIPVPVWGADIVVEICRQLVRDRVFEVCRETVAD